MFSKTGAPQREEMSTIQVKNTALHLNGQNLRLAAKNGRSSKTPGLHLSAARGKEAAGRLTACWPTREGAAQLDLLLKSPRPDPERPDPVRRPLALAPLKLPQEVREAQRQKLDFVQREAQSASCKLDEAEPRAARKARSCARKRLVKAAACPSAEPLRAQNRSPRPQLTRADPVQQTGDGHLEEVVCRGTPAPLCSRPAPPSLSPRVKAARGAEAAHEDPPPPPPPETGTRRLRLRRAQCLEEDQSKPAQGVQGRGPAKQPPAASWESGSVRKSHEEDRGQPSARCTLDRRSAEGGSGERALDGAKTGASSRRLKSKKVSSAKLNHAVALERLQL